MKYETTDSCWKMNEEIDEFEIYHQDFTTASEWEVFISRIEEILHEWSLSKSKISQQLEYSAKWVSKCEEIKFYGLNFKLSYHTLELIEGKSEDNDNKSLLEDLQNGIWAATANFLDERDNSPFPVSSWFGLKRYLMLYPSEPLVDGSLIKLVMSSVNIAFTNVDCGVPFLLK